MADNVQITQGSGTNVATDEIDGVQYQRVKLGWGADGVYSDVSAAAPAPITDAGVGLVSDAVYSGSGDGSLISLVKKLVAQFTAGFSLSGSVSLADAEGVKGQIGGMVANPQATFSRPADIIAYSANDMIANSTSGASVAYGTLVAARTAAGSFQIDRLRLGTNHTTGMAGVNLRVRLWGAQPVYSNGDNSAYAVSSGPSYAPYYGSFTGTCEQFVDVAVAMLTPDNGSPCIKLGAGQAIYWDLQTLDGFTPQSGKQFSVSAEVKQD